MGLSRIEIGFFERLMRKGIIAPGGDVLEFGQSEHAEAPSGLLSIIAQSANPADVHRARTAIATAEKSPANYQRRFGPARALYQAIFRHKSYLGVDLMPEPRSVWVDFNKPFNLCRRFAAVINNGTSEHVFNQALYFQAMHDHTEIDGLMIHWTPCLGWANHGLYNVQPGFFFDLARVNRYRVEHVELGGYANHYELKAGEDYRAAIAAHRDLENSLLCVALRRTSEMSFVTPMQSSSIGDEWASAFVRAYPERCGATAKSPTNLALGKASWQSSTSPWSYESHPASDAAGGNNGIITGYYGFHTAEEDCPWWRVDLGELLPVHTIAIYNRVDSTEMAERANGLIVSLSNDDGTWRKVAQADEPFGGADGDPFVVNLPVGESARHVKLHLPRRGILHLDEIEVH